MWSGRNAVKYPGSTELSLQNNQQQPGNGEEESSVANFEPLSQEYAAHTKTLAREKFSGLAAKIVELHKVLGKDGPVAAHASGLDYLRKHMLKPNEADQILQFAGFDATSTAAPTETVVKKAAALKFMRHLYMVTLKGNQQVWVLATPKSYATWPQSELLKVRSIAGQVKTKLNDVDEQFKQDTRQKLGEAMIVALAWVEKAKLTLSQAKSDPAAMAKVKRWFSDGSTSDKALSKTISKLQSGFKKIAATISGHKVMITEMPSLRSDPNQDYTEAFVMNLSKKPERPRVIYIEKALLGNYDVSVLHDMKSNWARVLVHECSHSDCGTQDHLYAFKGIQPGGNITAAEAAENADSWAFFAADAAGALTPNDLTRALGGTGGTLAKLAPNWN